MIHNTISPIPRTKPSWMIIGLLICMFVLVLPAGIFGAVLIDVEHKVTLTSKDLKSSATTMLMQQIDGGQVELTTMITLPDGQHYHTTASLSPTLSDGFIIWDVTDVSVDGQPASEALQNYINGYLIGGWRQNIQRALAQKIDGEDRVTDITTVPDGIEITVAPGF